MRGFLTVSLGAILIASAALAQTPTPSKTSAEHDFDYLLGDWQFVATNKQYG